MKYLLYTIAIIFLLSSCEKAVDEDKFVNEFSFSIDDTNYSYENFEISLDYLESHNRVFVKQIDEDNTFTFNLPIDLELGEHGLDWNTGGPFFYMGLGSGAFHTLNESTCKMNIVENDMEARRIHITFSGIGTQAVSTKKVVFSNGILKFDY